MSKTIIIPIVSTLALLAKLVFKVDISEDLQQQLVDVSSSVILVGVTVWGVFKNHKKK